MEGKSLIVYYSWVGNTEVVAKVPQKYIDLITRRIEKKGGIVLDSISITTTWDPSNNNISISPADVENEISDWISKAGVSVG